MNILRPLQVFSQITKACRNNVLHGSLLFCPVILILLVLYPKPVSAISVPNFNHVRYFDGSADMVATGDMNGDGAVDLIIANRNWQSRIYLNDGAGNFNTQTVDCAAPPLRVRCFGPLINDPSIEITNRILSIAVGDVDGNGSLDLVVGKSQQDFIYLNDGQGNFYLGPEDCTALPSNLHCFGSASDLTVGLALGDINGDGALDIAAGNRGQSAIYLNDGLANFAVGTIDCTTPSSTIRCFGSVSDTTSGIALGDMNGDTLIDVIYTNFDQNVVYLNDGNSHFYTGSIVSPCLPPINNARCFGTDGDNSLSLAVGDMDNDHDLDIIVGNLGQGVIYENDGRGNFLYLDPPCMRTPPRSSCFGVGSSAARSIVVDDLNTDGVLDIVVGSQLSATVYLNDGQKNFITHSIECATFDQPYCSVALGDMNGDGSLDFVTSGFLYGTIYLQDGIGQFHTGEMDCAVTSPNLHCFGSPSTGEPSMVVGDLNNDDAVDIVVGGWEKDVIYFNDTKGNFYTGEINCQTPPASARCLDPWPDLPQVLALGDVNNDHALDIIVSNPVHNAVYLNDGSGNFYSGFLNCATPPPNVHCFGDKFNSTIAVGDLNKDGAIDIISGNDERFSTIYLNDGAGNFYVGDIDCKSALPANVRCFGTDSDDTTKVTVGDVNADGNLDIVVGNWEQINKVYLNDGSSNFFVGDLNCSMPPKNVRCFGNIASFIWDLALRDVNADGALDIVIGSWSQDLIYLNDGLGNFYRGFVDCAHPPSSVRCFGTSLDDSFAVALGDINGDGALDIVIGNSTSRGNKQHNIIYLNDKNGNFYTGLVDCKTPPIQVRCFGSGHDNTYDIVFGEMNKDGRIDLIVANADQTSGIYLNSGDVMMGNLNHPPRLTINRPISTGDADFYSSSELLSSPIITFAYSLFDLEGDPVGHVEAWYSLNGGGKWLPALPTSDTVTSNLSTKNSTDTNLPVTHLYQWDVLASKFFGQSDNVVLRLVIYPQTQTTTSTGTFRYPNIVTEAHQGHAISASTFSFRMRGTQIYVENSLHQPIENAQVYQWAKGQTTFGSIITNGDEPMRTSLTGYLGSYGVLAQGDQLLALAPFKQYEQCTLYHTNAVPNSVGIDAFAVTNSGIQTLTVTPAHPLLLCDLTVSLEWNADTSTLSPEAPLFLTQLRENLQQASNAIYDWSNGQVALGRVTVYQAKEQWDQADIQVFAANNIRPTAQRGGIVSTTQLITLTTPHDNIPLSVKPGKIRIGSTWNRYGETQKIEDDWAKVLAHELAHYLLFLEDTYLGLEKERNLLIPVSSCTNTAMTDPYLDVSSEFRFGDETWEVQCGNTLAEMPDWSIISQIYPEIQPPLSTNSGPVVQMFALTQIEVLPAPSTTSQLVNDSTVHLNNISHIPNGRAYLIRPGQTIIDLGQPIGSSLQALGAYVGDELCVFNTEISACGVLTNNSPLYLTPQAAWNPRISLRPVTTTTIQIQVDASNTQRIQVTLYPGGQSVFIQPGIAVTVPINTEASDMIVDVQGDQQSQRMITGYTLDSGPGRDYSHGGPDTVGNGNVVLLSPQNLPDDSFMVIQTASHLPTLPTGLTSIGRSYEIQTSTPITSYMKGSITIQYFGLDVIVSGRPEESLAILYWDGVVWTRLETVLSLAQNFASASLPGPGIYVLANGAVRLNLQQIEPATAMSGQPHVLTITLPITDTFAYFLSPLTAILQGDSISYPLTIQSINPKQIIVNTPADLPADEYTLMIQHPGSEPTTRTQAFTLYTAQPNTTCFFDDFQSGMQKWSKTGEWNTATLRDGRQVVTDSPTHPYHSAASGSRLSTTLTIATSINLAECMKTNTSVNVNPVIHFVYDYQLMPNDSILLEISIDERKTWQVLEQFTGATTIDASALIDDEWKNVHWKSSLISLANYNTATDVRVRFRLDVDDFGSAKGWLMDEFTISIMDDIQNQMYFPLIYHLTQK